MGSRGNKTLRLEDHWVWDFWLAEDGPDIHIFFLYAPRSLGVEVLRHRNVRVGHAVSTDLRTWTLLPDALAPGEPGAWDDLAIWTGSIIRVDGMWLLFYTSTSCADRGLVQRIGLATSSDLMTWSRHGDRPLIEADPAWYEMLDLRGWGEVAWRDPWVFRDPDGNGYHALITARVRSGPLDARGVIGHAVSSDLVRWDVSPPISSPAGFGQLECPQVVQIGDSVTMVFSTASQHFAKSRRQASSTPAGSGTFMCRGPQLLGPFDVAVDSELLPVTDLYAGKLVHHRGQWFLMGSVSGHGVSFVGEIADPILFDPSIPLPSGPSGSRGRPAG